MRVSGEELDAALLAVASLVDLKSPYTLGHVSMQRASIRAHRASALVNTTPTVTPAALIFAASVLSLRCAATASGRDGSRTISGAIFIATITPPLPAPKALRRTLRRSTLHAPFHLSALMIAAAFG